MENDTLFTLIKFVAFIIVTIGILAIMTLIIDSEIIEKLLHKIKLLLKKIRSAISFRIFYLVIIQTVIIFSGLSLLKILEKYYNVQSQSLVAWAIYIVCTFGLSIILNKELTYPFEKNPVNSRKKIKLRRIISLSRLVTFFNSSFSPQKLNITLSIFLITLLCISVYQIFLAYVGIQNTILSIAEIDERIKYTPTNAVFINGIPDALTVSFFALIITAIGIISTQILGWRNDKRSKIEAQQKELETKLRIEKLELEIAELKGKNESSQKLIYTELNPQIFDKPALSLEKKKS